MAFDIVGAIMVLVGGNPILVVFLVSIIGNMIPFFPVPYLLFVITIASGFPGLGLFQIAAVSALAAVIGVLVAILLMRVDWEEVLVEGRRGMIRRLLKGIFGRNDRSKKQSDLSG